MGITQSIALFFKLSRCISYDNCELLHQELKSRYAEHILVQKGIILDSASRLFLI